MDFSCFSPDEIRTQYQQAKNKRTIIPILAEMTDSTSNEVRAFLGLPIPPKRQVVIKKYTPQQWKTAIELYYQGMMDTEISNKTGISRTTFLHWRHVNGLPHNRTKERCAYLYKPLPPEEEELRMSLYEQGLVDAKIAKRIGRSPGTVCEWRKARGLPANGAAWGHPKKKKED